MFKKVFFELNKNIAVITLNNPKKLNAWDFEMRSQIISLIKDIKKNKNIKALIFTGWFKSFLLWTRFKRN